MLVPDKLPTARVGRLSLKPSMDVFLALDARFASLIEFEANILTNFAINDGIRRPLTPIQVQPRMSRTSSWHAEGRSETRIFIFAALSRAGS